MTKKQRLEIKVFWQDARVREQHEDRLAEAQRELIEELRLVKNLIEKGII